MKDAMTFSLLLITVLPITMALSSGCGQPDQASLEARQERMKQVKKRYLRQPESSSANKMELAVKVDEEAPDISGLDVEGVEFRLSDYRGKVVLINYWGNW